MGWSAGKPINVLKITHLESHSTDLPLAVRADDWRRSGLQLPAVGEAGIPWGPSQRSIVRERQKRRKHLALREERAHTCASLGAPPETVRGEADRWIRPMPPRGLGCSTGMRGGAPAGVSMKPAASLARRIRTGRQARPATRQKPPAERKSVETGCCRAVSDLTHRLGKHHWPGNRKVSS